MKKKANAIRLEIKEPCSQDFTKMHPLPGGLFCDHCERTVVDFTGMTDREIVRLYQQRQGRVCGRFQPQQLDRPLALPQPPKEGRPWAAIAALATTLLLGESAVSQTAEMSNHLQMVENQSNASKKYTKSILGDDVVITGRVLGEGGEPLPFATVQTADGQGSAADLDGTFTLKIGSHLIGTSLTVSYTGYESLIVPLNENLAANKPIEIKLKAGLMLPEVVIVSLRNHLSYGGAISAGVIVYRQDKPEKEEEIIAAPEAQITVFPNPFISQVNVEMDVPKPDTYLFHLYNEAGQLMFAEARPMEAGHQTLQLDLVQRHLPEGAYFLRISDEAGEVRTKRLVKVSP